MSCSLIQVPTCMHIYIWLKAQAADQPGPPGRESLMSYPRLSQDLKRSEHVSPAYPFSSTLGHLPATCLVDSLNGHHQQMSPPARSLHPSPSTSISSGAFEDDRRCPFPRASRESGEIDGSDSGTQMPSSKAAAAAPWCHRHSQQEAPRPSSPTFVR